MSTDNQNGRYVSDEEIINAHAPVMVSVRKEGRRYHVRLRGEEIIIHEQRVLLIGREEDKYFVEVEGKRMIMDGAEFSAFLLGIENADKECKRQRRERRAAQKEVRNA